MGVTVGADEVYVGSKKESYGLDSRIIREEISRKYCETGKPNLTGLKEASVLEYLPG